MTNTVRLVEKQGPQIIGCLEAMSWVLDQREKVTNNCAFLIMIMLADCGQPNALPDIYKLTNFARCKDDQETVRLLIWLQRHEFLVAEYIVPGEVYYLNVRWRT